MFCRSILESDAFMDMPAESQMLYVHLSMAADDDGFVSNPRMILRFCGASDDSMKLLLAKRFVLSLEAGDGFALLIRHWRMHNCIKKDRYRPSVFRHLLRELYYDENRAYALSPGEGSVPCLPEELPAASAEPDRLRLGSGAEPQDRIEKDRTEKERIDKDRIGKDRAAEGEPGGEDAAVEKWRSRVVAYRARGWDPSGMYSLARNEGVTRAMIDGGGRAP